MRVSAKHAHSIMTKYDVACHGTARRIYQISGKLRTLLPGSSPPREEPGYEANLACDFTCHTHSISLLKFEVPFLPIDPISHDPISHL